MQRNYFSILFFIKKTKLLKNGEAPICLRITVNGKRAEVQVKRSVETTQWNSKKECANGKERKYQELNHYLEIVRTKVLQIHRQLEQDGKPITAEILKRRYYGEGETPKMLLEVFNDHNKKCRDLLDKDYVLGTVLRYERTVRYLTEYMKQQYRITDIPLKDITDEFIRGFEHYIKTNKPCSQNATVKYLKNLKKIVHLALANHWIDIDPFVQIKLRQTQANRQFLLEEEIKLLMNKEFTIPRLETVRDIFVFCCYTGLSYIDLCRLTAENIKTGFDGKLWIMTKREKTGIDSNIPLLEIPRQILQKYEGKLKDGKLLPVISNQKMNDYLSEIAALCRIDKHITFHQRRHTFATEICITQGVPIESVSKMLGHTNIKTTQIYARVVDRKVSHDMSVLERKINSRKREQETISVNL